MEQGQPPACPPRYQCRPLEHWDRMLFVQLNRYQDIFGLWHCHSLTGDV
jgi:hypothetical protein